jgi:hypothetical protein
MEVNQEPDIPKLWEVRICRPAFQDMHYLVLPRLEGRAELRRQIFKLQWWNYGDTQVCDLQVKPLPDSNRLFGLIVEEGYGFGSGWKVVFGIERKVLWIVGVLQIDEPVSGELLSILHARLNIAQERGSISAENPFGE